MPTPIITDGSTDRVQHSPRVVLPATETVFAERAARFEALAASHPMAEYLRLMAKIAQAQQAVLGRRSADAIGVTALSASRDYGMPPLSAQAHARGAQWREDLADLLGSIRNKGNSAIEPVLRQVEALDDTTTEALADRILAGTTLDEDAARVPFVGAALQVYFTRLASSLDASDVSHSDMPAICPVCATRPVASIVRIGGDRANLRYLVCALCSTEWNLTRIQCSSCQNEKGVHYLALSADETQQSDAASRAEACDECKSYLKIFYQEKDPMVEPHADDLATLALDVLVDERGFQRSGPNLLFHPGSP